MYDVEKMRFWCQKIIPLVYEDSLSYYETLCKVIKKLNEVIESVDNIPEYIAELISAEHLQDIMKTLLVNLEKQIAGANEGLSETATADRPVGTLVWLDGYLYRAIEYIDAGDRYVVDGNVEKITIEECIKDVMLALTDNYENGERVASEDREAGELVWFKNQLLYIKQDIEEGNAYTSANSEVVDFSKLFLSIHNQIVGEATARENADTALNNKIGNLANLETSDKSDLVGAVNSAVADYTDKIDDLGDVVGDLNNLPTTDKTSIVNSIIEIHSEIDHKCDIPENYGAVGDGLTNDTVALQACLNANNIVILNQTYLITQISMPSGCKIIGSGTIKTATRNNIVSMNDDCEINGITFTDDLTPNSTDGAIIYAREKKNLVVSDCTFATIGNAHCVMFEHCDYIRITRNNISDYGYAGIMLFATCTHADIIQNHLYNSRYEAGENSYPICFSGYALEEYGPAKYIRCNYNSIVNTFAHWEGIDSHGASNFEIIGNYIEKCRYGIALGDTPTSIVTAYADSNSNAVIKNNYIKTRSDTDNSMTNGIRINRSTGLTSKNIEVDNNFIEVVNTSDVTTGMVACITIRGTGNYENVKITNNRLYAVACHGVNIEGNKVINAQIDHNYFEYLTGGTARYGIRLYDLSSYDNIAIRNNSIDSTLTASARFYTGPTVASDSGALIEWRNNIIGNYDIINTAYDTSPKQSLSSYTSTKGVAGQFIPCTLHSTNGGWICDATGSWKVLTATAL